VTFVGAEGVWDIEVDEDHSYTSGGIILHNCSSPNLQNIPRPDENKTLSTQIRGLFVAPPGHSLIVADYGQIEYVVMAHLSRDPALLKAFNDGVDLHQFVAAMVFGKPMEQITKAERTTAKNTNFAVAYGAGVDKIAAMSRISVADATKFAKAHRKMLPTLYRWKDRVVKQTKIVRPIPTVTMLLGHQRQLPDINSRNDKAAGEGARQAVNTVVQGAAAEIIKLAMIRLHQTMPEGMALQLQVHDELVMSCPDDRIPEGMVVMKEAMLGEGIQQLLDVPMKIDIQAVKRWANAK
jgi:DNA polymerase-1